MCMCFVTDPNRIKCFFSNHFVESRRRACNMFAYVLVYNIVGWRRRDKDAYMSRNICLFHLYAYGDKGQH